MVAPPDGNMNSASDNEGQIDLWKVGETIWRMRRWVVSIGAIFVIVFGIVAFTMKPVYRAKVMIVDASIERSGLGGMSAALGQFGGLASLAGIGPGAMGGGTAEPLAVLRSREFTEAFIRDRNLIPVLYPKLWNAAAGKWNVEGDDIPTLARAFRMFDKSVRTVTEDRRTGLITLSIEWTDPNVAAEWANTLVARLNAEMRVRAIQRTNDAVAYLEKELGSTSELETRQAINRLMEAQIKQRMLANVTMEYSFRVVDRALPPDLRDKVRPKRLLMLLTGGVLGLALGIFAALFLDAYRARRKTR
jgi:uncharacterized protein involved in exopolysaccharide biosynthesis